MTGVGPTDQRPPTPQGVAPALEHGAPPAVPSPAMARAGRLTAANMLRSMGPLVVICLVIVGWTALRQSNDVDPVREIDPASTVQLAAARADYALLVPTGLDGGYRPTSARTDAGNADAGDPVTLEIGYVTPTEEFAGFAVSDDPQAAPLTKVLDDAEEQGAVDVGGQSWKRSVTDDGETVLSREAGGVTVVVSGSATDEELETVAAAVRRYAE